MTSRSLRFGWNVVWNMSGQAAMLAVSFVIVPYLVKNLGNEGYALYGFMGLICGYLAVLQFGASNATVKFISEFLGKKDEAAIRSTLQTSVLMHSAGVIVGAIIVFLLREKFVTDIFEISPALRETGTILIGYTAAAAVFFSIIQGANAILQGLQRFGVVNTINVVQSGAVLVGAALLVFMGRGMREICALYLAVHVVISAIALTVAVRALPAGAGRGMLDRFDRVRTRQFLAYSIPVFFTNLAWAITFQWDKFLIGYFFPLAHLTYYLIPAFLMNRFWVLPASIMTSAFPMISEVAGEGDTLALKKIYCQVGQLILWLVVPGFAILFVVAPQFLTLWIGEEFSTKGVWPMRFLLLGYLTHLLAAMPVTAAFGLGKPRYVLVWQGLQAILCLGLWFVLIPRFDITGAALGFMIAQIATSLPFAWLISRKFFAMGLLEYLAAVVVRPLAAGGVFVLYLWPLRIYAWNWVSLILLVAVSVLLYFTAGYWILGVRERETLWGLWASTRKQRPA